MAAAQKGAISFGLVYIPVSLHTATRDNGIGFNQLHKTDLARIRYKKVCEKCGKEVEAKDIVRGFEYAKDQYVVVTDEEIEKIKTEKDRTITIMSFPDPNEISPVYFDKAYRVVPEKGGGKALELLRQAMKRTGRAALGKTVMGNSETLILLLAEEDGILLNTLLFEEDIKDIPAGYDRPAVSNAELNMAEQLIRGMEEPFEPERYKDTFREKLRALIADKIAGKEVSSPRQEKPGVILDLMEALKASIQGSEKVKNHAAKGAKGAKGAEGGQARARKPRKKEA